MKIIEKHVVGKSGKLDDCEDFIFFNDNYACIIDGATSIEKVLYENKTPGQKIGELIIDALDSVSPKSTIFQIVEEINKHIQLFLKDKSGFNIQGKEKRKFMTASIALYSKYYKQAWLIGDCSILVNDITYSNTREINTILSNIRSLMISSEMEQGKEILDFQGNDIGREYILPILRKQYLFQNNTNHQFSYSAIDGFPVDFNKVKAIDIDSKYLIMASDGYPKLFDTLEKSEHFLKKIKIEDPLLINKYKSTKGLMIDQNSYDDRAFLKIEL